MRIITASDLHIGFEYANIYKINKFFDLIENETPDLLILNGDILDLWRSSFSRIIEENGDLINRINQVSAVVKTVWIIGNHDFSVPKDRFSQIEFRNSLNVDSIHIEHGHRFDMEQVRFGWLYGLISKIFPKIYYFLYRRPNKIITEDAGSMWLPMHDIAAEYSNKNDVNVIIGHSHMPQIQYLDSGNWVADSGDFIDSCSYIEINDEIPILKRI